METGLVFNDLGLRGRLRTWGVLPEHPFLLKGYDISLKWHRCLAPHLEFGGIKYENRINCVIKLAPPIIGGTGRAWANISRPRDCELRETKVKRPGKALRSRRRPAGAGWGTSGCSRWLRTVKSEEFAAEALPNSTH